MKPFFDEDNAGASTLGSLFAIVCVGAVAAVLYYAIQKSQYMFTGLSQSASNTIFYLEVGFDFVMAIFLIAVIINNWLNEKDAANQGV